MAYTHEGLRLKSPEAIAGGKTHEASFALAHTLQNKLANDLKYFTAFNDGYHHSEAYFKKKGNRDSGVHGTGLAMDIALSNPSRAKWAMNVIHAEMAAKGLRPNVDYKLYDEYSKPSKGASGGHLDLRFLNVDAANRYLKGGGAPIQAGNVADNVQAAASAVMPTVEYPDIATPKVQENEARIQGVDIPDLQQRRSVVNGLLAEDESQKKIDAPKAVYQQQARQLSDLQIKPLVFEDDGSSNPYERELAEAFGEYPNMQEAIPEHIDSLIKSIYDAA